MTISAWRSVTYSATMVAFSALGSGYFIGLFNPLVTSEFGVNYSALSVVFSLSTIAAVIPMFFIGRLFDVVSLRTYTIILLAAFAGACATIACAPNFAVYAIGVFFIRLVGDWLFTHAGLSASARSFGAQRPRLTGLAAFGYAIGPALFPGLALAATNAYGWRATWLAIAGIFVVVVMPILVWLLSSRTARAERRPVPAYSERGSMLVLDVRILKYLPVLMTSAVVFSGLLFHQSVWVQARGGTAELLSLGLSAYAISQTLAMFIAGIVAERFPLRTLVAIHACPGAAGLLLMLGSGEGWTIVAYLAAAGFTTGLYFSLTPLLLAAIYGSEDLGSARAAIQSMTLICAAISTTGVGFWVDHAHRMEPVLVGSVVFIAVASAIASVSSS